MKKLAFLAALLLALLAAGLAEAPSPTPAPLTQADLRGSWIASYRFEWDGYIFNGDGSGWQATGYIEDYVHPETLKPITYVLMANSVIIADSYGDVSTLSIIRSGDSVTLQIWIYGAGDLEGLRAYGKRTTPITAATASPVPSTPASVAAWLYGRWCCDHGHNNYEVYEFGPDSCYYGYQNDRSSPSTPMQYAVQGSTIAVSGRYLNANRSVTLYYGVDNGQYILFTPSGDGYDVYYKITGSATAASGTTMGVTTEVNAGTAVSGGPGSTRPLGRTESAPVVTTAPTVETVAESSVLSSIGLPGRMRVNIAQIDATGWLNGPDDDQYAPSRMLDGNESTSFQFTTTDQPLGKEYLYFAFSQPMTLDELWIKNGEWSSTTNYQRNSRVKTLTIDYLFAGGSSYTDKRTITLPTVNTPDNWQVLQLGRKYNVRGVRIRIDDSYKGTTYSSDVCISELMFVQQTAQ